MNNSFLIWEQENGNEIKQLKVNENIENLECLYLSYDNKYIIAITIER